MNLVTKDDFLRRQFGVHYLFVISFRITIANLSLLLVEWIKSSR